MSKLSGIADSPNHPPHLVNFSLGTGSPVDTSCFNPLHQFDRIGKKKLDQVFLGFSLKFILAINHLFVI